MIALATCLAALAGAQMELTLGRAVALARDSSAGAKIARSRESEASERANEARSALRPGLEASASQAFRSYNFLTGGLSMPGMAPRVPYYNVQDARLSIRAPLWAPASRRMAEAADRNANARRAERTSVSEDAALRAALAWVELSRGQALEMDRQEALALALDLERMAMDQKASGTATGLDVLRAQSQVVAMRRALSAATQARERAATALSRELGLAAGDTLRAVGELAADPASVAASGSTARERAADSWREAAVAEVAGARAKYLPVVALTGDYGWSGDHGWNEDDDLPRKGVWAGEVGIQLRWTVWDGGGDDSRLAQARERERQAAIGAAEARRQARLDEEDAAVQVERTREQLRLAVGLSALADSQLVLARDRFREGASGNLEVVQAQGDRNAAHAAWIEAGGAHAAAVLRSRWARGSWNGI